MTPLIAADALAVGDIVLSRVKGNQYLHLVKAIQGEHLQIGNNRGGINGWITRRQIFGRLVGNASRQTCTVFARCVAGSSICRGCRRRS